MDVSQLLGARVRAAPQVYAHASNFGTKKGLSAFNMHF